MLAQILILVVLLYVSSNRQTMMMSKKVQKLNGTGTSFLSTGRGKMGRGTTLSSQGSGRAPATDNDF
jgi:hypothetical protein